MKSKDWKTKVGVGFAKTGLSKFGRRLPSIKQIGSYLSTANEQESDIDDDIELNSPPSSPRLSQKHSNNNSSNANSNKHKAKKSHSIKFELIDELSLRSMWVMCIAIHPNGKLVATGGLDNMVSIYDINFNENNSGTHSHNNNQNVANSSNTNVEMSSQFSYSQTNQNNNNNNNNNNNADRDAGSLPNLVNNGSNTYDKQDNGPHRKGSEYADNGMISSTMTREYSVHPDHPLRQQMGLQRQNSSGSLSSQNDEYKTGDVIENDLNASMSLNQSLPSTVKSSATTIVNNKDDIDESITYRNRNNLDKPEVPFRREASPDTSAMYESFRQFTVPKYELTKYWDGNISHIKFFDDDRHILVGSGDNSCSIVNYRLNILVKRWTFNYRVKCVDYIFADQSQIFGNMESRGGRGRAPAMQILEASNEVDDVEDKEDHKDNSNEKGRMHIDDNLDESKVDTSNMNNDKNNSNNNNSSAKGNQPLTISAQNITHAADGSGVQTPLIIQSTENSENLDLNLASVSASPRKRKNINRDILAPNDSDDSDDSDDSVGLSEILSQENIDNDLFDYSLNNKKKKKDKEKSDLNNDGKHKDSKRSSHKSTFDRKDKSGKRKSSNLDIVNEHKANHSSNVLDMAAVDMIIDARGRPSSVVRQGQKIFIKNANVNPLAVSNMDPSLKRDFGSLLHNLPFYPPRSVRVLIGTCGSTHNVLIDEVMLDGVSSSFDIETNISQLNESGADNYNGGNQNFESLHANYTDCNAVAFSPHGHYFALGFANGGVYIFERNSDNLSRTIEIHSCMLPASINSICWINSYTIAASCDHGSKIYVSYILQEKEIREYLLNKCLEKKSNIVSVIIDYVGDDILDTFVYSKFDEKISCIAAQPFWVQSNENDKNSKSSGIKKKSTKDKEKKYMYSKKDGILVAASWDMSMEGYLLRQHVKMYDK